MQNSCLLTSHFVFRALSPNSCQLLMVSTLDFSLSKPPNSQPSIIFIAFCSHPNFQPVTAYLCLMDNASPCGWKKDTMAFTLWEQL